MLKRLAVFVALLAGVAIADNVTTISRLKIDHPNLGHTGGATLHTHIGDIYTKLGDNMGTRYKEYTAVANSAVTTYEHNFNVPFADMAITLWSGTGASKTRIENPTASGWTIAATSGFTKTKIDVTAPSSGGPHDFSIEIHSSLRALATASTSNVNMTGSAIDGFTSIALISSRVSDWLRFTESGGSDYVQIAAPSLASSYTLTLPNSAGNANEVMVTDGSGGLSFGKVANANVSASAAIDYSKLNLASSIVNADVSNSAAIAYSKLNLGSSIVNADVASGANIDASKLGTGVVDNTEFNYLNGVTSGIQGQIDGKLSLSGGVMTGNITLAGDATSALQPVTKQQFDAGLNGIAWKQPVRAASAAAGTLATDFENGDSFGGVTLATNDAILLKDQATSSENGIYTVNASGAPTRRADADAFGELNGAAVIVSEGTYANRGYYQSTELTSFSGQSWFQNFGTGLYLADGNGIELSGSTFSLELDGNTLSKSATGLKVAEANLTLDNIGGTLGVAKGGTGAATASGARSNLSAAASGANSDITSITGLTTMLAVNQGGTGGSTATQARTNLSAAQSGANSDITSITGLTTMLAVNQGGTGGSTATQARSNLSAAQSGANSDITSITGLTTMLAVNQGGTGGSTATQARTNLSAAQSGANSDITSITGLTTMLPVNQGGTGGSTATQARSNLSAAASGSNSDITALTNVTGNILMSAGNLGIGTSVPAAPLSVGSSSQFRVSSSGDLTRINNIAYSFPGSQATGEAFLKNDAAGNLSWFDFPSLTDDTSWGTITATADTDVTTTINSLGPGTFLVMGQVQTNGTPAVGTTGFEIGLQRWNGASFDGWLAPPVSVPPQFASGRDQAIPLQTYISSLPASRTIKIFVRSSGATNTIYQGSTAGTIRYLRLK